jgi:transcriptional regulator with XRE-family HTH domain
MARPELLTPAERTRYGQILKAARLAAGWTVAAEAAAQAGLTHPRLANLESGHRIASWPTLHQLVLALGLDPRLLFPAPKPEPAKNGARPRSKAKPKRPR